MKKNFKNLSATIIYALICVILGGNKAGAAEPLEQYALNEIVVLGKQETLSGGFIMSRGSVGLIGNRNIMDMPFQQTNLSQKTIDIFGANPSEASVSVLVNNPAIRSAGSTLYNDYSLRGQNASAYQFRINGIPNMLSQTNIPMNFVESVEITSGASIGINGLAASESAGGSIVLRTKRAHNDKIDYKTGFSGRSIWNNEFDIAHRFGKNKENGVLIEASHADGTTAIRGERNKATTFALNFDREVKESDTNLFLGYRNTHNYEAVRYFFMGKLDNLPKPPKGEYNFAFKDSKLGMKSYIATLNHVQKITDKTRAFFNAGIAYNNGYDYLVPLSSRYDMLNQQGDFSRTISHGLYAVRNTYSQIGIQQDWNASGIKNTTTIAFDKDWYKTQWQRTKGKLGTAYGNLHSGHVGYDFITASDGYASPSKTQLYGWSAINESTVGKASVIVGLHRHITKSSSQSGADTKSSAFSPLYGFVYKPTDRISLFANHVESFQAGTVVGTGYKNAGDILEPAKTKSNEVGVKFTNGRFYASMSYFDMKKQAQFDKEGYRTLDGRLIYKGMELNVGGEIVPKWSLTGGLLITDSKYEKNNTRSLDGKQVMGTPEWSGIVLLQYAPDEKTTIFGRAVYTGNASIYNNSYKEMHIPSSTIYDLGASYKTKLNKTPVTITATIFNLFNNDYWMPRATYCYGIPGNPRTFALSATIEF